MITPRKPLTFKFLLNLLIIFILCATSFGLGVAFNKDTPVSQDIASTEPATVANLSELPEDLQNTLSETLSLVSSEALNTIDQNMLKEGMINAVMDSLGDPYAEWLNKEESAALHEQINSQYAGMGLDTEVHSGQYYVSNVLENSAAMGAGVERGEMIVAVNGIPVMGNSKLFDAARELNTRTPKLTLKGKTTREITLNVAPYEEPAVTYTSLGNDIALIDINTFSSETADALKMALLSAKASQSKSIVFDVRNNLGGYMDACYDAVSLLSASEIVAYEVSKEEIRPISRTEEQVVDLPYIVLINKDTFSAAELFAQSLKVYGNATLIGQTTFGKGVQQSLFTAEDGTLKFSTAYFSATEDGVFSEIGIEPQIKIDYLPYTVQNDHFLEAAKRFLSNGLSP